MENYKITAAIGAVGLLAFLSQFGERGFDAMNQFIIGINWCEAGNGSCFFIIQAGVLFLIIAIAFLVERSIEQTKDWTKVKTSIRNLIDYDVIGGILVHNGSSVNLSGCTAELTRYVSDDEIKLSFPSISDVFTQTLRLPRKLFWYDSRELKAINDIGRGKDGFVSLIFSLKEKEKSLVVRDGQPVPHTYKVETDGVTFHEPFLTGWFYIRISADVDSKPLPFKKIKVRLDIENGTPTLKEVIDDK